MEEERESQVWVARESLLVQCRSDSHWGTRGGRRLDGKSLRPQCSSELSFYGLTGAPEQSAPWVCAGGAVTSRNVPLPCVVSVFQGLSGHASSQTLSPMSILAAKNYGKCSLLHFLVIV